MNMKTDIQIARNFKMQPIEKVAGKIGLTKDKLEMYGKYKAKINVKTKKKLGKLILVTAINPTKAGIGKTTVSIGLADAFALKNKSVCLALREPSLGPVFGVKGGATGGGYSQIQPMEDINLHFNGDFHAITTANNLLCAMIDNHLFQGNSLDIDESTIMFNRCMDMNDRALRDITINGKYSHHEKFNITAASEIMAIMCVAENIEDLKTRLGNIMIALNKSGKPIYARDLNAEEAMAILLKEALKPNLVQTLAGTPAIVHCGPFANIAHGCNSIVATKTAMSLAKYTITEAGFGSDLGAEKFLDFKCRKAGLTPNCVVVVATIRALKLHGGAKEQSLAQEDLDALKNGIPNLVQHIKNMTDVYKVPTVVTLNKYVTDTEAEVELVKELIEPYANLVVNDVWKLGGKGALELADEVIKKCNKSNEGFSFAYELEDTVENKIKAIATKIYGGDGAKYSDKAKEKIKLIKKLKLTNLPIIIAKTQFSLSDDKTKLGAPKGFKLYVDDIEIKTGVGFLVVICGSMMLMPGLPKTPAACGMTIDKKGIVEGLY
ncbi:MAG TPA: formate--tetrahydrofolate ligase [Clostridiales bacterium]|nr:formate--tetrahydrofolate ligase [Clostridiales bacterium]